MNFQRVGTWAEVSDCGRYTVSVTRHNGFFMFSAWRRSALEGGMATPLGVFHDSRAARACCESDAQKAAA